VSWYEYERHKPRRPAEGIKAQTQSGKFGKTWWASRWIAALELITDSARLARGRSYARSGQVVSLDVGKDGVSARVQGSRPQPYKVSIRFQRLADDAWEHAIDVMASEAIYAARLLSGEMPEQIESAFSSAGVTLFPARQGDLEVSCSCPDWASPCKHVAAVYYLLGERFDKDPFLIFALRGRRKDEIVASLRARRRVGIPEEAVVSTVAATEEAEEDEDEAPGNFWASSSDLPDLALTFEEPPVDAVPVKRLGKPAFWRSRQRFEEVFEEAYRAIGKEARRLL